MINAVAERVAFDFLVNGKWSAVLVIVKLHLRGVETGLTVDKIANSGVFYDHFGPERVAGKSEKVGFLVGGDFDDDISPTGEDMISLEDFLFGEGIGNDFVEMVVWCEIIGHGAIIT